MKSKKKNEVIRKIYLSMVVTLIAMIPIVACADDGPLEVVNKMSIFIFSLIRAIGIILLGLGIMQVGLSFKSHDPSQRANGFLTLAGGIVIVFTKEILTLIGVSV